MFGSDLFTLFTIGGWIPIDSPEGPIPPVSPPEPLVYTDTSGMVYFDTDGMSYYSL